MEIENVIRRVWRRINIIILAIVVFVTLILVISIWVTRPEFVNEFIPPLVASMRSILRTLQVKENDWLDVHIQKRLFGPDWFVENKHKYVNAFNLFELLFLDSLSLGISRELDPPSGIRELGDAIDSGVKLLENTSTMDFFIKSIRVPCRIFFVKAPEDYRIPEGRLNYFSKDKSHESAPLATHIMYCFGNNFGGGIVFKKEMPNALNKYYVPENNSIICFTNKDTYSAFPVTHSVDRRFASKDTAEPYNNTKENGLRYLMVILIFGNT